MEKASKRLFIITGAGRDGAAMLGARLSHEPSIRWIGNFTRLSTWDGAENDSVGKFIDKLRDSFSEPLLGFRLLAPEARTGRWGCLRDELKKRGVMVVSMRRRDTLKQVCSCMLERMRVPTADIEHSYVEFQNRLELIKALSRIESLYRIDDKEWNDSLRIFLTYEVIMSSAQQASLAWSLLGLAPPSKIQWVTKRRDNRRPKNIIRNYEQVRTWLHGTRWAAFARRA